MIKFRTGVKIRSGIKLKNLDPATVAYIQRVEADGGVVLSPQLVDAHIKAVKQIGITDAIYQLFASYAGIKIDQRGGVNYVTKMYSIFGDCDVSQGNEVNQPIITMGDIPTISFPRDSDYLDCTYPSAIAQPHQRFAAIKTLSTKPNDRNQTYILDGLSGAKAGFGVKFECARERVIFAGLDFFLGSDITAPSIIHVLFSGASSKWNENNVAIATGNGGTNSAGGMTIGNRVGGLPVTALGSTLYYNNSGESWLFGQVNRELTTQEMQELNTHLASIYGITLGV